MRPLDEWQRRRALLWAALLCAVPMCLVPLAARSSFEIAGERAAIVTRFNAPPLERTWNQRPVAIARDPFMPETRDTSAPAPVPAREGIVGMHVTQGAPIGYTAQPAHASGTAPLVTAIVTGPSPRALVDDGLHVRVVGIGDPLGGSHVISIERAGVRLANGTLVPLTEDQP